MGVAPGDMGEVLQGRTGVRALGRARPGCHGPPGTGPLGRARRARARAVLRAAPTPGSGAAPGHAWGRRRRHGEDEFRRATFLGETSEVG